MVYKTIITIFRKFHSCYIIIRKLTLIASDDGIDVFELYTIRILNGFFCSFFLFYNRSLVIVRLLNLDKFTSYIYLRRIRLHFIVRVEETLKRVAASRWRRILIKDRLVHIRLTFISIHTVPYFLEINSISLSIFFSTFFFFFSYFVILAILFGFLFCSYVIHCEVISNIRTRAIWTHIFRENFILLFSLFLCFSLSLSLCYEFRFLMIFSDWLRVIHWLRSRIRPRIPLRF